MKAVYKNIKLWFAILLIGVVLLKCNSNTAQTEWSIEQGYVPDSTTAVKIAEIIFIRVYGDKVLDKKPFVASLKNGIWIVDGTLERGRDGGVPHIEIQKSDGKIVYLIHGK